VERGDRVAKRGDRVEHRSRAVTRGLGPRGLEPVAAVRHERRQHRQRGVAALDRAELGRDVRESGLGERPGDLDLGVDAGFERAEDLEDCPVAERDRAVRLLAGDPPRRGLDHVPVGPHRPADDRGAAVEPDPRRGRGQLGEQPARLRVVERVGDLATSGGVGEHRHLVALGQAAVVLDVHEQVDQPVTDAPGVGDPHRPQRPSLALEPPLARQPRSEGGREIGHQPSGATSWNQ
jgi:hypothetical protein